MASGWYCFCFCFCSRKVVSAVVMVDCNFDHLSCHSPKKTLFGSSLSLPVSFEIFFVAFLVNSYEQRASLAACLRLCPRRKVDRWFFGLTLADVVPGFGPQRARKSE